MRTVVQALCFCICDNCVDSHYNRQSNFRYRTFVGGNLVTLRSKKQNAVALSSAKVEHRDVAHTASEML